MLNAAIVCLIVAVSDGDTLTARCGQPGAYQQVKIRLAGIDAPENGQDYSNRAKQALASLCHQQQVKITRRDIDRYGRMVADVECQGQDAGSWMVRNGWAMVYHKYAGQHGHLHPLERAATYERLGQWQMLNHGRVPVPPWDWRPATRSRQPTYNVTPIARTPAQPAQAPTVARTYQQPRTAQQPRRAYQEPQWSYPPNSSFSLPNDDICYVGPRGGTYTLTRIGRKNYSGC